LLVLSLNLLLGKLEPVRDLVDEARVEEIGVQLASEHLGDGSTASPKLPPNRDYRHGRNCEVQGRATRRL
jgi:hypothetical protein